MSKSIQLAKFQERCHEYHTCFVFATMGLQNIADKFRPYIVSEQNQSLFIGSGHPDESRPESRILLKDAVSYSDKDGMFSDQLAKSILIAIYAEWDEIYRKRIAIEHGLDTKDVKCDLMGELRLVRNWVVHNKSVVDEKHEKIKILSWHLSDGKVLKISTAMFSEIIESINTIEVSFNRKS